MELIPSRETPLLFSEEQSKISALHL